MKRMTTTAAALGLIAALAAIGSPASADGSGNCVNYGIQVTVVGGSQDCSYHDHTMVQYCDQRTGAGAGAGAGVGGAAGGEADASAGATAGANCTQSSSKNGTQSEDGPEPASLPEPGGPLLESVPLAAPGAGELAGGLASGEAEGGAPVGPGEGIEATLADVPRAVEGEDP